MNLTPLLSKGTPIKLLLLLACLIAISSPQTVCTRSDTQNGGASVSGFALSNCDQRCVPYSSTNGTTSGLYCCTGTTTTTNYDCLYGCNINVANNFQWP